MLDKLVHHLGIHVCKHPKESLATALTIMQALAPVALYIAGAAVVVGTVAYLVKDGISSREKASVKEPASVMQGPQGRCMTFSASNQDAACGRKSRIRRLRQEYSPSKGMDIKGLVASWAKEKTSDGDKSALRSRLTHKQKKIIE